MPTYGKIVVIKRSGTDGSQFILTTNCCTIGRHLDCDIRIQLPTVSKEHCKLEVNGQGQVMLTNISKVTPTLLNGQPIRKAHQLTHGDIFTVTERSFRWENPNMPVIPPRLQPTKESAKNPTLLSDRRKSSPKVTPSKKARRFSLPISPKMTKSPTTVLRRMSQVATPIKKTTTPPNLTKSSAQKSAKGSSGNTKRKRKSSPHLGLLSPDSKRKRVTFGPNLSPEQFKAVLPPNTPVYKGGRPSRISLVPNYYGGLVLTPPMLKYQTWRLSAPASVPTSRAGTKMSNKPSPKNTTKSRVSVGLKVAPNTKFAAKSPQHKSTPRTMQNRHKVVATKVVKKSVKGGRTMPSKIAVLKKSGTKYAPNAKAATIKTEKPTISTPKNGRRSIYTTPPTTMRHNQNSQLPDGSTSKISFKVASSLNDSLASSASLDFLTPRSKRLSSSSRSRSRSSSSSPKHLIARSPVQRKSIASPPRRLSTPIPAKSRTPYRKSLSVAKRSSLMAMKISEDDTIEKIEAPNSPDSKKSAALRTIHALHIKKIVTSTKKCASSPQKASNTQPLPFGRSTPWVNIVKKGIKTQITHGRPAAASAKPPPKQSLKFSKLPVPAKRTSVSIGGKKGRIQGMVSSTGHANSPDTIIVGKKQPSGTPGRTPKRKFVHGNRKSSLGTFLQDDSFDWSSVKTPDIPQDMFVSPLGTPEMNVSSLRKSLLQSLTNAQRTSPEMNVSDLRKSLLQSMVNAQRSSRTPSTGKGRHSSVKGRRSTSGSFAKSASPAGRLPASGKKKSRFSKSLSPQRTPSSIARSPKSKGSTPRSSNKGRRSVALDAGPLTPAPRKRGRPSKSTEHSPSPVKLAMTPQATPHTVLRTPKSPRSSGKRKASPTPRLAKTGRFTNSVSPQTSPVTTTPKSATKGGLSNSKQTPSPTKLPVRSMTSRTRDSGIFSESPSPSKTPKNKLARKALQSPKNISTPETIVRRGRTSSSPANLSPSRSALRGEQLKSPASKSPQRPSYTRQDGLSKSSPSFTRRGRSSKSPRKVSTPGSAVRSQSKSPTRVLTPGSAVKGRYSNSRSVSPPSSAKWIRPSKSPAKVTTPGSAGRGRPSKSPAKMTTPGTARRGRPSRSPAKVTTPGSARRGRPSKSPAKVTTPGSAGRGRPSKSPAKVTTPGSARRGRPSRSPAKVTTPGSARRGRPSKSPAKVTTPGSAGRGRPSKSLAKVTTPGSARRGRPSRSPAKVTTPVSAGRGRPSKSPAKVTTPGSARRGRPSKSPAKVTTSGSAGRGRPSKSPAKVTTPGSARRGRPSRSPAKVTTPVSAGRGRPSKSPAKVTTPGSARRGRPSKSPAKVTTPGSARRGRPSRSPAKVTTPGSARRGRPSKSPAKVTTPSSARKGRPSISFPSVSPPKSAKRGQSPTKVLTPRSSVRSPPSKSPNESPQGLARHVKPSKVTPAAAIKSRLSKSPAKIPTPVSPKRLQISKLTSNVSAQRGRPSKSPTNIIMPRVLVRIRRLSKSPAKVSSPISNQRGRSSKSPNKSALNSPSGSSTKGSVSTADESLLLPSPVQKLYFGSPETSSVTLSPSLRLPILSLNTSSRASRSRSDSLSPSRKISILIRRKSLQKSGSQKKILASKFQRKSSASGKKTPVVRVSVDKKGTQGLRKTHTLFQAGTPSADYRRVSGVQYLFKKSTPYSNYDGLGVREVRNLFHTSASADYSNVSGMKELFSSLSPSPKKSGKRSIETLDSTSKSSPSPAKRLRTSSPQAKIPMVKNSVPKKKNPAAKKVNFKSLSPSSVAVEMRPSPTIAKKGRKTKQVPVKKGLKAASSTRSSARMLTPVRTPSPSKTTVASSPKSPSPKKAKSPVKGGRMGRAAKKVGKAAVVTSPSIQKTSSPEPLLASGRGRKSTKNPQTPSPKKVTVKKVTKRRGAAASESPPKVSTSPVEVTVARTLRGRRKAGKEATPKAKSPAKIASKSHVGERRVKAVSKSASPSPKKMVASPVISPRVTRRGRKPVAKSSSPSKKLILSPVVPALKSNQGKVALQPHSPNPPKVEAVPKTKTGKGHINAKSPKHVTRSKKTSAQKMMSSPAKLVSPKSVTPRRPARRKAIARSPQKVETPIRIPSPSKTRPVKVKNVTRGRPKKSPTRSPTPSKAFSPTKSPSQAELPVIHGRKGRTAKNDRGRKVGKQPHSPSPKRTPTKKPRTLSPKKTPAKRPKTPSPKKTPAKKPKTASRKKPPAKRASKRTKAAADELTSPISLHSKNLKADHKNVFANLPPILEPDKTPRRVAIVRPSKRQGEQKPGRLSMSFQPNLTPIQELSSPFASSATQHTKNKRNHVDRGSEGSPKQSPTNKRVKVSKASPKKKAVKKPAASKAGSPRRTRRSARSK